MTSNLIKSVIGIGIAIIILASVLMPVISDARDVAGDEVTFNNRVADSTQVPLSHMSELKDTDLMVIRTTVDSRHIITINDEEYTQEDIGGNINWVMSDGITINQNSSGSQFNVYMPGYTEKVISATINSQITLSGGVITITAASTTITGSYTWAYYYDPDGEYVEVKGNNARYVPYYLNSPNQVICSGLYSSGTPIGYYSVKDGVVNFDGEYTPGLSTSALTKVSDTTDVFKGAINIDVGSASFQPYIVLVPNSVIGHEASGAAYSLYGAIPLVVVCIILLSAIVLVRTKDA